MKKAALLLMIGIFLSLYLTTFIAAQEPAIQSIEYIEWRPDGSELAVLTQNSLLILDEDFQFLRTVSLDETGLHWSPDSSMIAVGRTILNANTLAVVTQVNSETNIVNWSEDSLSVLALHAGHNIGVFDAQNGTLIHSINTNGRFVDGLSWSPDNDFVAVKYSSHAAILDMSGNEIGVLQPTFGSFAWSTDGQRMAGVDIQEVAAGTAGSIDTAGSSALITLHIWDSSNLQVSHTISGLQAYPSYLRWSPNGKYLIGGSASGPVYIWETQNFEQIGGMQDTGSIRDVEISPFGGRAAIVYRPSEHAPVSSAPEVIDTRFDGMLQIIVPNPTKFGLNDVLTLCDLPQSSSESLAVLIENDDMDNFITQVQAGRGTTISEGCAADLIAVAEAIQAQ